jgi:O-antigen/teichoic acid export membrane protein
MLNIRLLKHEIKYYKKISNPDPNLIKKILKFSLPFSLQEMIYPIFVWGTNFSIVYLSSYSVLGLLRAVFQWNAIVIIIPAMLKNVILSNISTNNNKAFEAKQIVRSSVRINFITSGFIAAIVVVLSKLKFFKILYTNSFEGIDDLIMIGVCSGLVLSISDVYLQFLIAKSENWLVLFLKFFRDVIKILLILSLIDYSVTEIETVNRVLVIMLTTNTLFLFSIFFCYRNFLRKTKNVS